MNRLRDPYLVQRCYQRGLSLVELLVAMLIGLFLIGGVIVIFLVVNRSFAEGQQTMQTQLNAQVALDLLQRDLRHVGFWGNLHAAQLDRRNNLPAELGCAGASDARVYRFDRPLVAETSTNAGIALNGCITDALPNTGVVLVKFARPRPMSAMPVSSSSPLYMLSNSSGGVLFSANDANPPQPNDAYAGGEYWEYLWHAYYVRQSNGVPTLARRSLTLGAGGVMVLMTQDLVEGIEDLQVDRDNLERLRLSVLARSLVPDASLPPANLNFNLGSRTVARNDSFQRQVLTTTVSRRNFPIGQV